MCRKGSADTLKVHCTTMVLSPWMSGVKHTLVWKLWASLLSNSTILVQIIPTFMRKERKAYF